MGADFCVNFCDMFVGQKINLPFLCFVQKKTHMILKVIHNVWLLVDYNKLSV